MTTERPFGVVPLDQADGVDVLRSEIPLLERWIYMNTGTSGPSPRAVTEAQIDWIRRLERDGGGSPATSEPLNQLVRDARHAWARILGAPDVGNIALTHNTSEGLAIVAAGLPRQPGDEVIVSELEHLSGLLPWRIHSANTASVVRNVKASGGNLTPEDVEAVMTDRTRLLCFSHVGVEHRGHRAGGGAGGAGPPPGRPHVDRRSPVRRSCSLGHGGLGMRTFTRPRAKMAPRA